MNREDLKTLLPHRDNMLLLDEAELCGDNLAQGRYHVRGDEWFLQGHLPGNPVVPGVILCEIMAQACCVLLGDAVKGTTPYFTGLNRVRFRRKVLPGDTLCVRVRLTQTRAPFYFAQGEGFVGDEKALEGELSFMLAPQAGAEDV